MANRGRKPKMIENWQIKRLWAISAKLGFNKDALYDYCETDSLHKISYIKANEIIKALSPSSTTYNTKPTESKKQLKDMITEGQKKKIWRLMYQLKDLDTTENTATLGKRLCGVIKRELSIQTTEKDPFIWIRYDGANKLIEILKNYVKSAQKRGKNDRRQKD